jgi:NhaC family Na+:H+ antiporter
VAPETPASLSRPTPGVGISLLPVLCLVALLAVVIGGLDGGGHIPLVLGTAVAASVATWGLKMPWRQVEEGMVQGIAGGLSAVLVLLVVGMLVGVWIAAGVVPLLIHYGLMVLSPGWFLVASCIICSVVALATGSSWSTAATVGLALIGVGQALGVDPGMTAGAIVSGSYFGDKMSPLSDTTNLAPAAAGAELFEHIQHMLWTTVPALIIALIGFTLLGLGQGNAATNATDLDTISTGISSAFHLSPVLLLPPLVVLGLVIKKVPALPALLAGTLVAAVLAMAVQGASPADVLSASMGGYESKTGVAAVDKLLSRGGMDSMLETVALIVCALAFAGVMEASGMLDSLAKAVLKWASGNGGLVVATAASAMGLNVLASDQYIAIIVPGRMYRTAFLERRLHPKNLSRVLEDAGTMTSALVPWNTCGAYMAGVLGVATTAYAPFALMNLLTPLLTVVYGFSGFSIHTLEEDDAQRRLSAIAGS